MSCDELGPLRELAHVRERLRRDDARRVVVRHLRDVVQPDAHGAVLDRAFTPLRFTSGGRTSTPRFCASRTSVAGG